MTSWTAGQWLTSGALCRWKHAVDIDLHAPWLSFVFYAFSYSSSPDCVLVLVLSSIPMSQKGQMAAHGWYFIHWAALGISHIPLHLALTAYNIVQCYTTYQMPPMFTQ